MVTEPLSFWYAGAPVPSLELTRDFAWWYSGAPVLQFADSTTGIPSFQLDSLGFLRSSG